MFVRVVRVGEFDVCRRCARGLLVGVLGRDTALRGGWKWFPPCSA